MKREARDQARQLRQQGKSVKEITKILGVSKASVSAWTRDILLTEEQIDVLNERRRHYRGQNKGGQVIRAMYKERRLAYQEVGRVKAREMRPLHMAGCMLYWAEGAKSKNHLYFVNSDVNMLLLFMRFLREEMKVEDSAVTLRIHCHTTDSEEIKRIEDYWANLLGLPISCIRKTQVKKGSEVRHNVLQNGVCAIAVNSTEMLHQIFGAIQEYGGFENPDWLF